MRRLFCALLLIVISTVTAARAAERVDLALVLAADVSRSVNDEKFELQRRGYAAAITDHRVIAAIQGGTRHRIALMYVEWSGLFSQQVVIDWTMIDGAQAARAFADKLLEAPRSFANRTSISAGIDFAVSQLARTPYFAERQTIDVSGDGTNNSGRQVTAARDAAVALGITINGLVILSAEPLVWNPAHTNPPGGLAAYYRSNVVGGPGAFVMQAKDFNSFGDAIIKKMIAEIALGPRPARPGRG
jgi:Protein of unknown function (DUF1194)